MKYNKVSCIACVWALLFALGSFYLALGGTVGTGLLAEEIRIRILARDPAFLAALWVTGSLKLAASAFAVALSRSWKPSIRRVLSLVGWITGVGLILWGCGYLVLGSLMLVGVKETPPSWGPSAAQWYVVLWGPLWILGGALFLASVRRLPMPSHRDTNFAPIQPKC
jgi:hypothetical protein